MSATQITPDPTRQTYVTAIESADKLVGLAALTFDQHLMLAARQAQRAAWDALENFDRHGVER